MKGTTIKVLRGRVMELLQAESHKWRAGLEAACTAHAEMLNKIAPKVERDMRIGLARDPMRYITVQVCKRNSYNNNILPVIGLSKKGNLLADQIRKSHGYKKFDGDTAEFNLRCHSLAIGTGDSYHHQIRVPKAVHDKFQPFMTKIDNEFLKDDPSQIAQVIDNFIKTLK